MDLFFRWITWGQRSDCGTKTDVADSRITDFYKGHKETTFLPKLYPLQMVRIGSDAGPACYISASLPKDCSTLQFH